MWNITNHQPSTINHHQPSSPTSCGKVWNILALEKGKRERKDNVCANKRVTERDLERQREGDKEREREREREK
jgi:hypothetical protein